MNIPKSKRSSFFLIVFIITYFYLLICGIFSMITIHEEGVVLGDFNAIVVMSTVIFGGIVAALLIFLNKKFRPEEAAAAQRTQEETRRLDILIPVIIYVLVLLGRGLYIALILHGKLSGETWIFGRVTDDRYDLIPGEQGFGNLGMDWLYAVAMKPFCLLLGYNAVSVYALNTLCQVATVFCIYALLKMIVGKAGATAFGCLFVGIPYFYECISVCEPAYLTLLLVSLVLILYVRNLRVSVLERESNGELVRRYFLMGILAGVLCFMDPAQIWLPIAVAVFYFVNVKKKPIGMPFYLIGLAAGVFVMLALFGLMVQGDGMFLEKGLAYFQQSITLYEESIFSGAGYMLFNHNPELLVLIILSGSMIFLYFKCEHDPLRMTSASFFLIMFACAANAFQSGAFFIFYCIVVLIAAMAYGMLFMLDMPLKAPKRVWKEEKHSGKDEIKEEAPVNRGAVQHREPARGSLLRESVDADTGAAGQPALRSGLQYREQPKPEAAEQLKPEVSERFKPEAAEQLKPEVSERFKPEMAEQLKPEESRVSGQSKEQPNEDVPQEKAADTKVTAEPAQKPKPRMIRNPLPVPPKHEHKKPEYAYDVPKSKMHYDVQCPEDDDYDRIRM